MNEKRRKELASLVKVIEEMRTTLKSVAEPALDNVEKELDQHIEAEQTLYDRMSDGAKDSQRGERIREGIEGLESVRDDELQGLYDEWDSALVRIIDGLKAAIRKEGEQK